MTDSVLSPPPFRLTDQQSAALHVADSSVALSAGAGCGKTMVLTERFLSALDDAGGRPLRALVALTFTEKAARELRQRIRARCRAKLASAEDPSRWWAILRGLDAAPIGTFHQFCTRLLRRHALLVGIDPEFAILDESIAGSLREEAVRSALRLLLAARNPDLIDLGTDYGLRQVREALGRLASSRGAVDLDEWSRLAPEAIVERWRTLLTDRIWPTVRDRALPMIRHCRHLMQTLVTDNARIRERRATLLEALNLLEPGELPGSSDQLDALLELLKVINLPRKPSWPSDELYEAVKVAFAALRENIKDRIKPALEWDDSSVLAAAGQSLRFGRLAQVVRREHENLKHRRRGLDFDDLIALTRNLLREHPEVVAPPQESAGALPIEFVLVDEFQDTDRLQSEILRRLSGLGIPLGTAVRGRRHQAVDLPVPRCRAVDLRPLAVRVPRAGPAQPDGEFPERPRRDPLRQRALRRVLQ